MNSEINSKHDAMRHKILYTAAKIFLEKGYDAGSFRTIANETGYGVSSVINIFRTKEDILAAIVAFVLERQFKTAAQLVAGKTDDPVLFYAAETTLQLYMAESSEHIRGLYAAAYSMPKTSSIIQHTITGKLEHIFKSYLPQLETKDFYELEIASGGIMRGFMTIPCDMYFTMERKVNRFLETTFLVYRVPDEKIKEAVGFVSQFDYPVLAQNAIDNMLKFLEENC